MIGSVYCLSYTTYIEVLSHPLDGRMYMPTAYYNHPTKHRNLRKQDNARSSFRVVFRANTFVYKMKPTGTVHAFFTKTRKSNLNAVIIT